MADDTMSTADVRNASLFESGRYSDMTLSCGGRSWKLHKNVVLVQSVVFEKMCEGAFREARENSVDLPDDDASAVAAMIYYFYHGYYNEESSNSLRYATLVFHVKVYTIAEKYLLDSLRKHALDNFKAAVLSTWHTDAFAEAIEEIYATIPSKQDSLRRAVVTVASARAFSLLSDGRGDTKFKKMAWETAPFSAELAQALACPPSRWTTMGSAAVSDEDRWVSGLSQPRDPSMPDPDHQVSPASPDEPLQRAYRCPSCRTVFQQRIWDGEKYFHVCSMAPRRTSPIYSGLGWMQYLAS